MDYKPLAAELSNDPLARGYATMTDAAAAADLNSEYRTTLAPTLATAKHIMAELGAATAVPILDKLEAAAGSDRMLYWVMKFVTGTGIDLGNAETQAQLDALAAAGVLTQTEADLVKSLGYRPLSRAREVWGAPVTEQDVGRVR